MTSLTSLRGLPPLLPFSRAALVLARVLDLPPFRPSSAAASLKPISEIASPNVSYSTYWPLRFMASNFQRGLSECLTVGIGRHGTIDVRADCVVGGVAEGFVFGHLAAQVIGSEPVDLAARALSLLQQRAQTDGVACESGAELVGRELCEEARLCCHGQDITQPLGFCQ